MVNKLLQAKRSILILAGCNQLLQDVNRLVGCAIERLLNLTVKSYITPFIIFSGEKRKREKFTRELNAPKNCMDLEPNSTTRNVMLRKFK